MTPTVRIFDDIRAVSEAAAQLFIRSCQAAFQSRGRGLVALSGGSTPAGLYALLAQPSYARQVDWAHVHVFWGDERCVPPDDPQSNYRQARDVLLSHVLIPSGNVHRVQTELEPSDAAQAYALTLKAYATPPLDWPRFDFTLLGMGDDGHTASLFPLSPVETSVPAAAVSGDYQGRPAMRVTLTPPVLNASRRVVFLVSGQSKSLTLAHVLYGSYDPALLPAERIRPPDGELVWLVDRPAASKL